MIKTLTKPQKLALSCVLGVVMLGVVMLIVWAITYHAAPFFMGLGFGMITISFIRVAWNILTKLEGKKNGN